MQELKIAMFGPRYVGKTSLLTSMYQEINKANRGINIQLIPDQYTQLTLGKRLAELENLSKDFEGKDGIISTEAAAGPESIRSFIFDLGRKGTKPSLRLHFQDFPGAYLLASDQKEWAFAENILKESVAVVIAIDTPALMEKNSPKLKRTIKEKKFDLHEYSNRGQEVTDWFKKTYQDLNNPRLVILAPVKCESYVQTSQDAAKLLKRVKEEYANLLDLFSSPALASKVSVVVTPVQTVGNVFFSRVELINEKPHFHFSKRSYDEDYNPKNCEQPLKYILRFVLRLYVQNQWGILNFIREWLHLDQEMKEIIREYAKDCKTAEGFEVIQGKNLLNI